MREEEPKPIWLRFYWKESAVLEPASAESKPSTDPEVSLKDVVISNMAPITLDTKSPHSPVPDNPSSKNIPEVSSPTTP